MNKEELKQEIEAYLNENFCSKGSYCSFVGECKEGSRIRCSEFEFLAKHLFNFTESREKQIQIDAEQIRTLQKQNGELTDKVKELTDKVKELEAQIEKVKHYLDYDIPHDLINEATTKIWRMLK